MPLKLITPSVIDSKMSSEKTIFLGKNGSIAFSKSFIDESKFKNGDRIIFFQDERRPKDWYFKLTDSDDSFKIKNEGRKICVRSSILVKTILDSMSLKPDMSYKMKIADKLIYEGSDIECYPILTNVLIKV